MSQYPSNFGQQPGGSSPPSMPSGSPYGAPQPSARPKGPNWLLIIGIVVGLFVLGGAGLGVCCCGGGALAFPALTQAVADQVAKQVKDDPVMQEHIGDIEKITYNFTESTEASAEGGQKMAFDVVGSKGSGLLVIEGSNSGGEIDINYGELVLPDGSSFYLDY